MRSGSLASFGLFGSKSGSDTMATISPVFTLATMPDGGMGVKFFFRLEQFIAQCVLDADVDGKLDRLLQPVGRKAGAMQVGEAVGVEPFLDAGNALVVDIDEPDQVRHLRPVRIDALVLAQEADAGDAEAVNVVLLLRRDLALQPDKALAAGQPLPHFAGLEVG